jgi:hypothetical protein
MTTYKFRNLASRGRRYSIYVERFVTASGTRPVTEWFDTMDQAIVAAKEMKADGRFFGISSYVRSQAAADSTWN